MNKKALYPGSFDPFTNGHLDIVKKASALFEEVYILIGINAKKNSTFSSDKIVGAIEKTLEQCGITNARVAVYEGLVAEYAKENGIHYMIRGLRNNMDYNYEENIAVVNKLINPELESIFLRAENAALSSSMVKELNSFGQDISQYVPQEILSCIQNP